MIYRRNIVYKKKVKLIDYFNNFPMYATIYNNIYLRDVFKSMEYIFIQFKY